MSRAWYKMKRRLRLLEEGEVSRERHARELDRQLEKVNSLLEKIAKTRWHHEPRGGYCIAVTMNPDVLGGVSMYRDDLSFLAKMIGRQVEGEIASGHFVQAAYQSEYDSMPPLRRVPQ